MDSKTRKLVIWMPILLAFAVIIGIFLGARLQSRLQIGSRTAPARNANKVGLIMNLIEENYVDSVDSKKIVEAAIPEMLKQLDPHTVYIPAKDIDRKSTRLN